MTREVRRAYRVLGLETGATPEQVKTAYRDLVQVWHPDRFGHSDKLREKAQRNFQRINEAYRLLKHYQPPAEVDPESILSITMSAVLDMGDIMQTREINKRPQPKESSGPARPRGRPTSRRRSKVMGLQEWERTGVIKKPSSRRRRRHLPWWVWIAVALLVLLVGLGTPVMLRLLSGP